jgi:hypothetical protein
LPASFTETGVDTKVFRATLDAVGGGAGPDGAAVSQWVAAGAHAGRPHGGVFEPVGVRVKGLADARVDDLRIDVEGASFRLDRAADGYHYLKGGSSYYLDVRTPAGADWPALEVLVWDSVANTLSWQPVSVAGAVSARFYAGPVRVAGAEVKALTVDLSVNGDDDLNDPEDGLRTYLPGYESGRCVLFQGNSFNSATQPQNFQEQRMRLIAPVGRKHGVTRVKFLMRGVTAYPGFCENATCERLEGPYNRSDFSFFRDQDSVGLRDADVQEDYSSADIYCKDFGGSCEIRVIVYKGGRALPSRIVATIPWDPNGNDLPEKWEREMVQEWGHQYGETIRGFSQLYDIEKRDPDGGGPLVEQKTIGDHIPAFAEYRGFVLDGGGHDGTGQNRHPGGHKRLSPARKEALLEVDREATLMLDPTTPLPPGGLQSYLDVAAIVWSNGSRGAGNHLYYILDDENLPATGFLARDTREQAESKQKAYLKAHRGCHTPNTLPIVNERLWGYFTHFVVLSDVPVPHRLSSGWSFTESQANTLSERGCYLLTTCIHEGATAVRVSDADYGGTTAAHEYMHMVIAPTLDEVTWDRREHLIANPGGHELMGDASTQANSQERTVTISSPTQRLINFRGNPALERVLLNPNVP